MKILQCYHTENLCYQKGGMANHVNVLVHGCAAVNKQLRRYVDCEEHLGKNLYDNHWNRSHVYKVINGVKQRVRYTTCVHGFVGEDKNGEVIFAQILPFGQPCWGCSRGDKGSYNYNPVAHIQFEICRGSKNDPDYYWKAIGVAAEFCAYMCQQRGFNPAKLVSHKEAHALGYANNHKDPDEYMEQFGDTMDAFRERVAALAAGDAIVPEMVSQSPSLRHGDSGQLVEELQSILVGLGYDLGAYGDNKDGIDGKFGNMTETALMAFQTKNGLLADGVCGQATWDVLTGATDTEEPNDQLYTVTIVHRPKDEAETLARPYGEHATIKGE